MTRCATHSIAIVLCLLAGSARADVAPPPPDSCPYGGTPSTCHGGPYCYADGCTTDSECTANGETCRELSVCIGTIGCGGLIPPDADLSDYARPTVKGTCAHGASCSNDSTCETRRICAPPEATIVSKDDDGGCSVRAPGERSGSRSTLTIALSLLGVLFFRRRLR